MQSRASPGLRAREAAEPLYGGGHGKDRNDKPAGWRHAFNPLRHLT